MREEMFNTFNNINWKNFVYWIIFVQIVFASVGYVVPHHYYVFITQLLAGLLAAAGFMLRAKKGDAGIDIDIDDIIIQAKNKTPKGETYGEPAKRPSLTISGANPNLDTVNRMPEKRKTDDDCYE